MKILNKLIRKKSDMKNNNGSTLVFVIVACLFIGLLASLVLALSVAGYRMKVIDYQSRQNFYEGEEYSGKIYADLGMNSIGILGESYVDTMAKLTSGTITGKTELNDYMKQTYYKNIMLYLGLVKQDPLTDLNNIQLKTDLAQAELTFQPNDPDSGKLAKFQKVEEMLTKIIERDEIDLAGTVTSVDTDKKPELEIKGDIVCQPEGGSYFDEAGIETKYPMITINDVHIQYVDKTTKFESNYTFDVVIKYPDWTFTFANPANTDSDIDTFLDYVLISNKNIDFTPPLDSTVTVTGCVSSGNNAMVDASGNTENGINVNYCTVKFNPNPSNWYEKMNVVVSDNLVVKSSATNSAQVKFGAGKLWCNSIVLKKDATTADNSHFSQFTADKTELYIQDDLQLDGPESEVTVTDAYYYGFGTNTSDGGVAQNTSSAVIVNGAGSSVRLGTEANPMKALHIYGVGYVDLAGAGNYRTGESLAIKSNQDMYLVPNAYMGLGVTNPTRKDPLTTSVNLAQITQNIINGVGTTIGPYYAYSKGWLNATTPVTVKTYTKNSKTYYFYYLNFATPSGQSYYAESILSNDAITGVGQEDVRKQVKDRVRENTVDQNNNALEPIMKYYSNSNFSVGAFVNATGAADKANVELNAVKAEAVDISYASIYRKRYRLMKSILVDTAGDPSDTTRDQLDDYKGVPCQDLSVTTVGKRFNPATKDKYTSDVRDIDNLQLTRSVISNVINLSRLSQYAGMSHTQGNITGGDGSASATLAFVSGNKTITSFRGVMVVDGDVTIEGDVRGLIVATGKITVSGSGSLTSDPTLANALLTREQDSATAVDSKPISDVFYFYPTNIDLGTVDEQKLKTLDYSDVLYYDNWSRYERE